MLLRQESGRRRTRGGFTLVELLAVMLLLGILAAIAVSRMWGAKERSHWSAVKNDLHNMAVQQERYFADHMQYAANPADLPDMQLTDGVMLTITWTANNGWAATGTHGAFSPLQCGMFLGPAPAGVAAPATQQGQLKCDE